jgi:hypothetical protein
MSTSYKLDDSTIGLFAQLIQLALLTGTDVVDNFRAVHLSIGDSGKLIPDPAFREQFDANIQKLMDHVSSLTADNDVGEDNAH